MAEKATKPTRTMLAAIGEIAAESARVEDLMRELFSALIDSPYGAVITAGEDLSRVCQLCARVAQYNVALSDHQITKLAALINAIDAVRPHRNFFVHSRWEYVPSTRTHVGVRSSRPSQRANGADLNEVAYTSPPDALKIAEHLRTIADSIEPFIAEAFPEWTRQRLMRRTSWKRMHELFGTLLRDFPPGLGLDS
ncbi:hypothetical protein [Zhihengliuella sp. ISTPL4]|uniref:hypothetical protein n=1 Tax=Zhihengliuella sp. ISTPL4 TaxID=2058657 RepID=UPI0013051863|nr:hypothetical protein [Zhihengliuella sp. ISTPL4]